MPLLMTRLKLITIATLLICHCAAAQAANAAMNSCDRELFRQFDFWLGHWEVKDQTGKFAGRNAITAEQNGCVVVEQWQSASGSTGMSMNYYEPRSGHWKQNWVSPDLILEMSGGLKDDSMILEGPMQYVGQNRVTLLRGIWTPLPDGRVRQHFVESTDGGKTWNEWFDGYYSRVAK